jgi:transcriptional regulator with XRE-family HTH domain
LTGPEFYAARRRLGLTQVKLAAALGVVQGALADWERGRRSIAPETEERIRELVRVPDLCGSCLCHTSAGLPCGCAEAGRWGLDA